MQDLLIILVIVRNVLPEITNKLPHCLFGSENLCSLEVYKHLPHLLGEWYMANNKKEQEWAELHRVIWSIANDLRAGTSTNTWRFREREDNLFEPEKRWLFNHSSSYGVNERNDRVSV